MRIFVTGATGFVGSRVVRRLGAEHEIYAVTRSPEGAQRLLQDGIQPLVGDLCEPPARLIPALRGFAPEAVLHLAGETAMQRSPRRLWAVNAEGTRRLLEACAAAASGPLRFLYASTVVVGDAGGALLREDVPLRPTTAYGLAKLEGERVAFAAATTHGFAVTVLRPSHVYGAGGWFAEIAARLRRGRFAVPGPGDNLWDLVHVDDVAEAFVLALADGAAASGHVFHVVDDEPTTMRVFLDATADALGVARPRPAPVWLAKLVAGRGPVDAAIRSACSSNQKIKERLGWRPRFPSARAALAQVIAELDAAHSQAQVPSAS